MKLIIVKINKRLYLKDEESGKLIYTPPDFIRHRCNREMMNKLAVDIMESGSYIKSVIRFESDRLKKTKRF
ncbi:hypothetical protein phiOC_p236 [Ochrobactrum phage vB_OspM_OC]|nr:hypothetical protein phiOC_p236 [Ochrobactrum phage vB_OspM_OC]